MNDDNHIPLSESQTLKNLMLIDAFSEATPEQKKQLCNALANDAALAARHAALSKEVQHMNVAYGTQQLKQASTEDYTPIPANILTRLESTRREALAIRRGQADSLAKIVSFPSAILNSKSKIQKLFPIWLARAAMITLLGIASGYWLLRDKAPPIASAALAPRGSTGLTQPLIVWDNKPDQKYDVWILPPEGSQTDAPALFTAKNVRSPIAFNDLKPTDAAQGQKELQPGKPYRLLVCFASLGRLAGVTVPFETTAEADGQILVPSDPQAVLLKARRLIEAGRTGDALMVLTTLPENQRGTPQVRVLVEEAKKKLPAADKKPRG